MISVFVNAINDFNLILWTFCFQLEQCGQSVHHIHKPKSTQESDLLGNTNLNQVDLLGDSIIGTRLAYWIGKMYGRDSMNFITLFCVCWQKVKNLTSVTKFINGISKSHYIRTCKHQATKIPHFDNTITTSSECKERMLLYDLRASESAKINRHNPDSSLELFGTKLYFSVDERAAFPQIAWAKFSAALDASSLQVRIISNTRSSDAAFLLQTFTLGIK